MIVGLPTLQCSQNLGKIHWRWLDDSFHLKFLITNKTDLLVSKLVSLHRPLEKTDTVFFNNYRNKLRLNATHLLSIWFTSAQILRWLELLSKSTRILNAILGSLCLLRWLHLEQETMAKVKPLYPMLEVQQSSLIRKGLRVSDLDPGWSCPRGLGSDRRRGLSKRGFLHKYDSWDLQNLASF